RHPPARTHPDPRRRLRGRPPRRNTAVLPGRIGPRDPVPSPGHRQLAHPRPTRSSGSPEGSPRSRKQAWSSAPFLAIDPATPRWGTPLTGRAPVRVPRGGESSPGVSQGPRVPLPTFSVSQRPEGRQATRLRSDGLAPGPHAPAAAIPVISILDNEAPG